MPRMAQLEASPDDNLIRVADWATKIGVCVRTAQKKVAAGDIEVVNVGTERRRRLRVTPQAHAKWCAENKATPPHRLSRRPPRRQPA